MHRDNGGYDGLYYAQIALDPTLQDSELPRAMDKRIDLGYEGVDPGSQGVVVEANPTLLMELMRNLVDNALNYTPSTEAHAGVVTVRVLADRFGQVVVFQVEDNGPGIPAEFCDTVFDRFVRLPGSRGDGCGLGLAIVRTLVMEELHGEIELTSGAEGGTKARLTIPVPA